MLSKIIAACAVMSTGALATATRRSTALDSSRGLDKDASICNLAWSNSGQQKKTDCSGSDVIFSSVSGKDADQVKTALANVKQNLEDGIQPEVEVMCYLSVGTVHPGRPILGRQELADLRWKKNGDSNGNGGTWGDYWYDPDDLMDKVLPIMKDVLNEIRDLGFTMVSSDNAKPTDVVADHDSQAAEARSNQEIDSRYRDYMAALIDHAHSLGLLMVLKNPSYYNNHGTVAVFDAYIVESLFNWYPYDIDIYREGKYGDLLDGDKPVWIFQYEGVNGVSNYVLSKRMKCEDIPYVYMDSKNGWYKLAQSKKSC